MARTRERRTSTPDLPSRAAPDVRRPRLLVDCLVVLWVGLLYFPTLSNGFTYDDPVVVRDAADFLSHPSLLPRLFTSEYFQLSNEATYRPFVTVTYLIDWQMGAGSAAAFHAQNVLWHLVAVGALLTLLRQLGAGVFVAPIAAVIYGVHPAVSEAVEAVAFREDVLVTALSLLGLVAVFAARPLSRITRISLAFLCFSAALLSKETAVVLLVLLPLTQWAHARARTPRAPYRLRDHVGVYAALGLLVAAYLAVRFVFLPTQPGYAERLGGSLVFSAGTGLVAAAHYLWLFVNPAHLCADYRGVVDVVSSWADWRPWAALVLIGAVSLWLWIRRREYTLAAWGWAWFLVALLPVSNLVPIPAFMAERFLHLPFAGLTGAVVALAGAIRVSVVSRRAALLAATMVTVLLSTLTWMRHEAWASNESLWRTTMEDHPKSQGGLHGYANVLIEQQRFGEAVPYLQRALEDRTMAADGRAVVFLSLGRAYAGLGQLDNARASFESSLAAAPTAWAYQNLAIVLFQLGSPEAAESQLHEAIRLQPDWAEARSDLGAILGRQRKFEEAIVQFREAVRLQPDHLTWRFALATLLAERGETASAIEQLQVILKAEPGHQAARDALGRLSPTK
jgi:tetratricopeptide (TPR) repeat protein